MIKVLGVDPGLSGAIASWDGKTLKVVDVPIMKARSRGHEVNLPALKEVIDEFTIFHYAYVERNVSRPGEGSVSGRKSGVVEGMLLGCIAAYCSNVFRPTPASWKKKVGLTKEKEYSRTKAIETFPKYHKLFARKKDHNRAEAAMLAYYGYAEQNFMSTYEKEVTKTYRKKSKLRARKRLRG